MVRSSSTLQSEVAAQHASNHPIDEGQIRIRSEDGDRVCRIPANTWELQQSLRRHGNGPQPVQLAAELDNLLHTFGES